MSDTVCHGGIKTKTKTKKKKKERGRIHNHILGGRAVQAHLLSAQRDVVNTVRNLILYLVGLTDSVHETR